jgi:hypothetical protein
MPAYASPDVLREWVIFNAPDLRIRKVRLEDGRRACGARFTFAGEPIEVEAVESPEVESPDDEVVRRAAWVIHARLGTRLPLADAERESLERAIVDAAREGNADAADALGRAMAQRNERPRAAFVRTRFEDFGGRLFERDQRR